MDEERCEPCENGQGRLNLEEILKVLEDLEGWELVEDGTALSREYRFANYYETMSFVNAVAWIAHQQNHHPDLEVSYNRCTVRWSTHSTGGVTRNDLICVRQVNRLQA